MTLQMIVRDAMVESRNDALEAAIKVCEEVMKQGGGAAQCVVALRRLRAAFPKTDGVER